MYRIYYLTSNNLISFLIYKKLVLNHFLIKNISLISYRTINSHKNYILIPKSFLFSIKNSSLVNFNKLIIYFYNRK